MIKGTAINDPETERGVVKLNALLLIDFTLVLIIADWQYLFGGYMAVKGTISVGTFYMFYSYLGMMIYPLLDLPQLFVSGKQAFVNIDRLEEIKIFPAFTTGEVI